MTIFTIRPDDTGVQSLKRKNTRPTHTKAVSPAASTNWVHTAQTDDQSQAFAPIDQERRQQQRRQKKTSTTFDTRSEDERRAHASISNSDTEAPEDTEETKPNKPHIDVSA